MHKFLFYNKFIICLYMFRGLCAHHQEVKIVLYSIWYHHTCRWPSDAQVERGLSQPVHRTATYRCDDSICCIIQFSPPDDEHILLETCRGIQWTYYRTRISALSWLIIKIILRCTVSETPKNCNNFLDVSTA